MNKPSTWHDLADELADWQHTELAHREPYYPAEELLDVAREMAADNLSAMLFPDIPDPAHAVRIYGWTQTDGGQWIREYEGPHWRIHNTLVYIAGIQDSAGRTTATVAINSSDRADNRLTAKQSRELAAALIDAAGHIDNA